MPQGGDFRSIAVRTDDWPAQAADTIVRVVGTVRDNATGRVLSAAKAVVYGLLVAVAALILAILTTVLAVRLLDAYLPDAVFGRSHTWMAHLAIGGLFSLTGLFLLVMARRPAAADDEAGRE